MPEFKLPENVIQILSALNADGHAAYLVGGCVRDMLMGITPQDWDICTGALPDEVMRTFPDCAPTGLKHGTVTVYNGDISAEVTTFRTEGAYPDHRRPESVSFVNDLESDLSRRDFTVNAIALSADGKLCDPFGGREDIKARIIRCVGYPTRRFNEDALRMLRALRFSARLGFEIEENTLGAIRECSYLAAMLAPERIAAELEKILMTDKTEILNIVLRLGLISHLDCGDGDAPSFSVLSGMPQNKLCRWVSFAVLLNEHDCVSSAAGFLSALRLDSKTIRCCERTEEILLSPPPESSADIKRLLSVYGYDPLFCAAEIWAVSGTKLLCEIDAVIKSGECFSLDRLAVSGSELIPLGFSGKALGEVLRKLLDHVIAHPEDNERGILLRLAGDMEDR